MIQENKKILDLFNKQFGKSGLNVVDVNGESLKYYCNRCNQEFNNEDLNDTEHGELNKQESFICSPCINFEMLQETNELSDAEILNDIETRVRNKADIKKQEINLLLESYNAFNIDIPKDIKKLLNIK